MNEKETLFMENNILDTITQIKDVLPKKQRTLCNFIVLNYVEAGMMTVAELAERSGVGATTVMRLVKTLHYDSYSDFRRALLNVSLKNNASSYIGIKNSFQKASSNSDSDILHALWYDTTHTVDNFITPKNIEQLDKAITLMMEASRINLLGLRSSRTVSLYLESAIDRFYPHVRQLSNESEFLYDKIFRLSAEEDIIIIFSAWPCTKRTIDVSAICRDRHVPIILVTNTSLNPIARYADIVIDTNSVNSGCGILPLMFIAEALTAELARRLGPDSMKILEELESELDKADVFMR